jgi:hypothetical protein
MDDELLSVAREAIGGHYGLTPEQSARLHGATRTELERDAVQMRSELGMPPLGDGRARDEQGRFTGTEDMNSQIRRAAGRG